MNYTYLSAAYANEEGTAVIAITAEASAVAISKSDRPDLWADLAASGVTIDQWVAPPVSLPDLAPYQFRAMLALSGKQADLEAFVEALPEPSRTVAKAKLEYSLTFRRDNDLVKAAEQALGLTTEELDGLWLSAASIT